jgi:hypothetical protein
MACGYGQSAPRGCLVPQTRLLPDLASEQLRAVLGEIKRHFRDTRWRVHVKRLVQELMLEAREAVTQLTQELGRSPAEPDLARHLGVSDDDLRQARLAETGLHLSSLDAPAGGQPGGDSLADLLGEEDPRVEHMLAMQAVAAHWAQLAPHEQQVLLLRFHGDMTQAQIGRKLGMSQIQVFRLLPRALGYLRPRLLGQHEHASGRQPGRHPLLSDSPHERVGGRPASAGVVAARLGCLFRVRRLADMYGQTRCQWPR